MTGGVAALNHRLMALTPPGLSFPVIVEAAVPGGNFREGTAGDRRLQCKRKMSGVG